MGIRSPGTGITDSRELPVGAHSVHDLNPGPLEEPSSPKLLTFPHRLYEFALGTREKSFLAFHHVGSGN